MKNTKKCILLVSYGSSYPTTQKMLNNIEHYIKQSIPEIMIHWAYTSNSIRKKLALQGVIIKSPTEALVQIKEEGFSQVIVQSLHIIPGKEYQNLKNEINKFNGIASIKMGNPLLYHHKDINQVSRLLANNLPSEIDNDEAIIFMGHGTSHTANIYYPAFQYYLNQHSSHLFISTLEGYPTIKDTILQLREKNIKNVRLIPFMLVAGKHVQQDMIGTNSNSWRSILEKEGFNVDYTTKVLAEIDSISKIWVQKIETLLR